MHTSIEPEPSTMRARPKTHCKTPITTFDVVESSSSRRSSFTRTTTLPSFRVLPRRHASVAEFSSLHLSNSPVMSASIVGARCEHSASPPRGIGEKNSLYTSDLDWRFDSTLQSARNSGAGEWSGSSLPSRFLPRRCSNVAMSNNFESRKMSNFSSSAWRHLETASAYTKLDCSTTYLRDLASLHSLVLVFVTSAKSIGSSSALLFSAGR